jgi:hypothetical protein
MKLLIENFKKFLNEQQGQQSVSFDTEGVQTTIEFLGMHTKPFTNFVLMDKRLKLPPLPSILKIWHSASRVS